MRRLFKQFCMVSFKNCRDSLFWPTKTYFRLTFCCFFTKTRDFSSFLWKIALFCNILLKITPFFHDLQSVFTQKPLIESTYQCFTWNNRFLGDLHCFTWNVGFWVFKLMTINCRNNKSAFWILASKSTVVYDQKTKKLLLLLINNNST